MKNLATRKKRVALSVGEAVRFIRELRELTQEQLAALAELPLPAVAAIENDRIPLGVRQARALAAALRCHPGVLLFPDWGFTSPPADEQRGVESRRHIEEQTGPYGKKSVANATAGSAA